MGDAPPSASAAMRAVVPGRVPGWYPTEDSGAGTPAMRRSARCRLPPWRRPAAAESCGAIATVSVGEAAGGSDASRWTSRSEAGIGITGTARFVNFSMLANGAAPRRCRMRLPSPSHRRAPFDRSGAHHPRRRCSSRLMVWERHPRRCRAPRYRWRRARRRSPTPKPASARSRSGSICGRGSQRRRCRPQRGRRDDAIGTVLGRVKTTRGPGLRKGR